MSGLWRRVLGGLNCLNESWDSLWPRRQTDSYPTRSKWVYSLVGLRVSLVPSLCSPSPSGLRGSVGPDRSFRGGNPTIEPRDGDRPRQWIGEAQSQRKRNFTLTVTNRILPVMPRLYNHFVVYYISIHTGRLVIIEKEGFLCSIKVTNSVYPFPCASDHPRLWTKRVTPKKNTYKEW